MAQSPLATIAACRSPDPGRLINQAPPIDIIFGFKESVL
jgi:hypothetical protein